jgi:hypothetical protein
MMWMDEVEECALFSYHGQLLIVTCTKWFVYESANSLKETSYVSNQQEFYSILFIYMCWCRWFGVTLLFVTFVIQFKDILLAGSG